MGYLSTIVDLTKDSYPILQGLKILSKKYKKVNEWIDYRKKLKCTFVSSFNARIQVDFDSIL